MPKSSSGRVAITKNLGNKPSDLHSFSGIQHHYCKQKTGISIALGKVPLLVIVIVVIYQARIINNNNNTNNISNPIKKYFCLLYLSVSYFAVENVSIFLGLAILLLRG